MALINRVSRLFRADMHAILDRIEEPDVLLKQAVREMEAEMEADEQRIKLMKHEEAQTKERKTDIEQLIKQVDEELDVCFDCGNLDLARTIIRRKLEAEQMLKRMERKLDALENAASELNFRIQDNSGRLASMQQKLELLAGQDSTRKNAGELSGVDAGPDIRIREEDIEIAFLREQHKRAES